MNNLALTYWNQGRWKEAEELEVQVREIRTRVLGGEHPDTLTSMSRPNMQRRYPQLQRHYISVHGPNLVAEDDSQLATNTQEKVSPRVLALEISADH
ncbi:uncharacterized protein PV06_11912 [Exophiala oligosperma]|uniref:Kinesin light chain n=1 Tax=Exophiala oligosperma TaxID=215243 RepID=A0A0D2BE17_9EURO|nr:uncharacterized protein PV06_11912 [Exophiala oligosperma]KIW35747.1 hypothetical protein PV06_11912 [Exophiala oligosperma]